MYKWEKNHLQVLIFLNSINWVLIQIVQDVWHGTQNIHYQNRGKVGKIAEAIRNVCEVNDINNMKLQMPLWIKTEDSDQFDNLLHNLYFFNTHVCFKHDLKLSDLKCRSKTINGNGVANKNFFKINSRPRRFFFIILHLIIFL